MWHHNQQRVLALPAAKRGRSSDRRVTTVTRCNTSNTSGTRRQQTASCLVLGTL